MRCRLEENVNCRTIPISSDENFSPDRNSVDEVSLDDFGRTIVGQIMSNLLDSSGPGSSSS